VTQVFEGDLAKMGVVAAAPVRYRLGESLDVNALIGRHIRIVHTGAIHCRVCGRAIPKAYGEGYCFPHFRSDPANAPCVVRPELCEAHEGRGRDPAWERAHHDQPHVVYLANSGGLKVGVTRETNLPARWIDQGAAAAVEFARTPHRHLAGVLEVALKAFVGDKTRWRRMLAGADDDALDLAMERDRIAARVEPELSRFLTPLAAPVHIAYPVACPPAKVTSINLSKVPEFDATLVGIRGQYLVFEDGRVLNVRRHTGFEVAIETLAG